MTDIDLPPEIVEQITQATKIIQDFSAVIHNIRELHKRREWEPKDGMSFDENPFPEMCSHCNTKFPCETIVALGRGMGIIKGSSNGR